MGSSPDHWPLDSSLALAHMVPTDLQHPRIDFRSKREEMGFCFSGADQRQVSAMGSMSKC